MDFDSLKSLNADLGIDMSFLDTMKKDYDENYDDTATESLSKNKLPKLDEKTSKELQDTIQKNAELIQELKVRLSIYTHCYVIYILISSFL